MVKKMLAYNCLSPFRVPYLSAHSHYDNNKPLELILRQTYFSTTRIHNESIPLKMPSFHQTETGLWPVNVLRPLESILIVFHRIGWVFLWRSYRFPLSRLISFILSSSYSQLIKFIQVPTMAWTVWMLNPFMYEYRATTNVASNEIRNKYEWMKNTKWKNKRIFHPFACCHRW